MTSGSNRSELPVSRQLSFEVTPEGTLPNLWQAPSRCMQWFDESSLGQGASILPSSNARMCGIKELWENIAYGHEHDESCLDLS